MPATHVVVLAAGRGTRMMSALPKVLHHVAGLPMIDHVLRAAAPLGAVSTIVVVGHMAERVRAAVAAWPGLQFAEQHPQLGTAHALLQTEPWLTDREGTLVLLSGDVPLLRTETLRRLVQVHREAGAAATVVTAVVDRPEGYGRIVRAGRRIVRIVEDRDASAADRQIAEINTGIYAFDLKSLFPALREISRGNAQGEYYLPDIVPIYRQRQLAVETLVLESPEERLQTRGINSRKELADVSMTINRSKNEALMAAGVTIEDPAATYVGPDVEVGPDTVLHPGVFLEGRTRIGAGCEIHSGVRIIDSVLEDRVVVQNFCVIAGSRLAAGAVVGPFAHLRPQSEVGTGAKVGNFVEMKKTALGAGSKANHLSYLGDATIGERVNVGAGTITCNYDGVRKHQTLIEDGAFIGSDTQLIAPVRIGRGAYIAAGSSITEDVPPAALGIARARQVNKEGWAHKKEK